MLKHILVRMVVIVDYLFYYSSAYVSQMREAWGCERGSKRIGEVGGMRKKENACCWLQTDDDKQIAYFSNKQEVGEKNR